MRSADIVVTNAAEVYNYYAQPKPMDWQTRLVFRSFSTLFSPDVHFDDGNAEQITESIADGRKLILAVNHLSRVDPGVLVSVFQRTPSLQNLADNSFTAAVSTIFHNPRYHRYADAIALPVFKQDDAPEGTPQATHDTYMRAASMFVNACVTRLEKQHMFIFPEGNRNLENPHKLQRIYSGVGHILQKASNSHAQPAIVPVGIAYNNQMTGWRTPTVHIGSPSEVFDNPRQQVKPWIEFHLQASVDAAFAAQGIPNGSEVS